MEQKNLFWLKLLNVRKEESTTVRDFFLHHFFLGLALAMLLTVAGTIFLSRFPVTYFPVTYMISAVALLVTGKIYSWFEHRISIKKLLTWVLLVITGLTVLFRLMFLIPGFTLFPILLIVGFRVIYLLSNLEFWGLSSLMFDVRQGKRLFGLISSGDVPAKLLGYLAVYILVPMIRIENLIFISIGALVLSYFYMRRIFRNSQISFETLASSHLRSENKSVLKSFFGNEFIISLSIVAFLTSVSFTLIDFTFLSNVQTHYQTQDELASFLSIFFGVGYALTLIIKLIFSGRLSQELGIRNSLLLLPIILIFFSLIFLFLGTPDNDFFRNLVFIGIMSMSMGVAKLSVNDPVFLAMFQPLQTNLRLKAHTVIKGFIQPLALGITGFFLWMLYRFTGEVNFYIVNYGLLIIIVIWIVSVFLSNKKYFESLKEAIRKRFISGAEIAIKDSVYLELIKEKLKSDRPSEVIHSMSLLERINPELLRKEIYWLIKHEDELVVEKVVSSIRNNRWSEFVPILLDVFHTNNNEYVRAQAIYVYSSLNDNAGQQLLPGLDKLSTKLKTAIISGLIKSEDLHGRVAAEQRLVSLISSNIKEDKILACKIIEQLEQESLNKPIAEFMRDPDPDVKFAAVQAAAKIRNAKLIPPLLGLLESNFNKKQVILALSKFGDESVVAVKNYLHKHPSLPDEILYDLSSMLEKIASPLASGTLVSLLNYPVAEIRHRVLDALNSINHEEPLAEKELFHELLDKEFQFVYQILSALNDRSTARELRQPLGYELQKCSERVFDILGLLYNRDIVKRAEAALQLAGKEKKANALEILDHIIPKKTHDILVGMVDNISREERLTRLKKFASDDRQPLAVQIIQQGREKYSDWTVATALRTTPVTDGTYIFIIPYLESKNSILKQSAISALRQLYESDPVHFNTLQNTFKLKLDDIMKEKESTRLSDIEKVFVLKSTDLFSGTPENVIAEIVPIVKEEFVSKDQVIFHKGDSGSSMYIIYEGEIKIHDGDKVYAMLGSRDFFGELALLDPEPRSASATANTDTLLLKLDEEEAYELMEERTEVLKSIMRILCRRIRNQNEKISRMPVTTG